MSLMSSSELLHAVTALWQVRRPQPGNLYTAPAFVALRQVCHAAYPNTGSRQSLDFALSQAIYNLGFRWTEDNPSRRAVTADTAAEKIEMAFHQTRSRHVHLCPLDQADEMPSRCFGPNSVRDFTSDELRNLVDPHGVLRQMPDWKFDGGGFSQFSWLVVEESVDLPDDPGERAFPSVWADIGQDFGRIQPHRSLYPEAVQKALFGLLTAPWEDVTVHSDFEWRPFRIPWVYSLSDDLFARIPIFPSVDSLSWEPDHHQDDDGEMVEYERPTRHFLESDADEKTQFLNHDAWGDLVSANGSPLFKGPVEHFFVRAFVTDGIDEFLAHILVVESSLGLVTDQSRRPKLTDNPGATARVAARLCGLVNDQNAGRRYLELFAERSRFLHGRAMTDIPSISRLDARRLARRCVCALIRVATSGVAPEDRDVFLNDLLLQNWPMT